MAEETIRSCGYTSSQLVGAAQWAEGWIVTSEDSKAVVGDLKGRDGRGEEWLPLG